MMADAAMRQESFVENLVSPISAAVERFGDKATEIVDGLMAREDLEETDGFLFFSKLDESGMLFARTSEGIPREIYLARVEAGAEKIWNPGTTCLNSGILKSIYTII